MTKSTKIGTKYTFLKELFMLPLTIREKMNTNDNNFIYYTIHFVCMKKRV